MSRELDAQVAREVMGWKEPKGKGIVLRPKPWSTDMNAAMEVVAHFDALGWIWTLQSELKGRWRVMLTRGPDEWIKVASDNGLAEAICLAAREAVKSTG